MKWIKRLALFFVLGLAVFFGIYLFQISRSITLSEPLEVTIEEGAGTEGAIQQLWEAHVISSRWAFTLHLLLTGKRTDLKAGTYIFEDKVTIPLVIDIVSQKKTYNEELEITTLEGWTVKDMAKYLSDNNVVDYDYFLQLASSTEVENSITDKQYTFLEAKPSTAGLEGYLFPDTYRIFRGETEEGIIEKMLDNFDVKITDEMQQDITDQGKTLFQVLTLASIVEKEAQTPEDKKIVAGVFWKRLENNMRLQSDVTVNYATGKQGLDVSLADLQVESAYNTYRNNGLPPTPLNNPGLDSINAVIYPTNTEYWYFIATPEGEVLYAATYEQHLEYKHQYYD